MWKTVNTEDGKEIQAFFFTENDEKATLWQEQAVKLVHNSIF